MPKPKWPETLSVDDRIKLAQAKTRMMVTHVLEILALHENNSIIVYSDKLAGQIPESTAANAFNTFQQSMHRYEIVRICALWDSVEAPKENIPTVIALIQSNEVIERLAREMESYWNGLGGTILNPSDDPELAEIEREAFAASEKAFGREQGAKVREELGAATSLFKETSSNTSVIALRNLRDKKLAHLLSYTRREEHGPIPPVKYGYETNLLDTSIRIIEALYLGVCGTSFDFANSRRIDKGYAEALWGSCSFALK